MIRLLRFGVGLVVRLVRHLRSPLSAQQEVPSIPLAPPVAADAADAERWRQVALDAAENEVRYRYLRARLRAMAGR